MAIRTLASIISSLTQIFYHFSKIFCMVIKGFVDTINEIFSKFSAKEGASDAKPEPPPIKQSKPLDCTGSEDSSYQFKLCISDSSLPLPDFGIIRHLPITYKEELNLVKYLQSEFDFSSLPVANLKTSFFNFLWKKCIAHFHEFLNKTWEGEITNVNFTYSLERAIHTKNDINFIFCGLEELEKKGIQYRLDLQELDLLPSTSAAYWFVFLREIKERRAQSPQISILYSDIQTFIAPCNTVQQAFGSIIKVISNDVIDDDDLKYIGKLLKNQQRELSNKFN